MINFCIKKPFSLYFDKILFLSKLNKSGIKLEPEVKKLNKLRDREEIKSFKNLSEKYLFP